jgi:hypothetical protein
MRTSDYNLTYINSCPLYTKLTTAAFYNSENVFIKPAFSSIKSQPRYKTIFHVFLRARFNPRRCGTKRAATRRYNARNRVENVSMHQSIYQQLYTTFPMSVCYKKTNTITENISFIPVMCTVRTTKQQ